MVCLVYLCRIAQARTSHARLLIAANSVQKPFNQSISVTLKKSNSFH